MKGDEAVHSHKSSKLRLRAVERKHWTFNNKKNGIRSEQGIRKSRGTNTSNFKPRMH
jgi:hypothetical protein